jgi:hypothetical protein
MKQRHSAHRVSLLLIVAAVLLAACGNAQPEPTPTAFVPQVTLFAPTAAPTETPSPMATTPPATATPEPQAAAAVSDTTASPVALGENVNPYTGLVVDDPGVLQRKPLLIKVANTAEVRPQSGLSQADVVVEHLSEGSITRFTALFLSNAPEKVGSVRSCRLIDIELPVMFDAALTCSGTSPGVKPLMRNSYAHQNNLTMISDFGPYECANCPMYRVRGRSAPHNLFANSLNAWNELDKRGVNAPSTFRAWTFDANPPAGKETREVDVAFRSGTVGWNYDAGSGKWLRTLRNEQQVDAENREKISADNVVLVYAHHQTTLIQEDVGGSRSIEIQVWGEGPVRIFRDGREIGGRWKRGASVGEFEFFDVNGNTIPLKPGNTWIEMVPIKGEVPVTTK